MKELLRILCRNSKIVCIIRVGYIYDIKKRRKRGIIWIGLVFLKN